MKLTDLSELEAVANVAQRGVSPFEDHFVNGKPLEKVFTWFGGRAQVTLHVIGAAVADQVIRTAESVSLSTVSAQARIDTYLAIASVKSMTLGSHTIAVEVDPDWSSEAPFIRFSSQLSNEQLQTVVETHKAFQAWLDGQRQALSQLV
jgi:hypothetical protein